MKPKSPQRASKHNIGTALEKKAAGEKRPAFFVFFLLWEKRLYETQLPFLPLISTWIIKEEDLFSRIVSHSSVQINKPAIFWPNVSRKED